MASPDDKLKEDIELLKGQLRQRDEDIQKLQMQLETARSQAAWVSAKRVIAQPFLQLKKRLSQRASHSKTNPVNIRTFSRLREWVDFVPGACELEDSLEDDSMKYQLFQLGGDTETANIIDSAADEAEVRGPIVSQLHSVNRVHIHQGSAGDTRMQFAAGGSGRSVSHTDALIRLAGSRSDRRNLGDNNYGTVEFKGDWQLELPAGMSLRQALADPKLRDQFLRSIQQVYGDAVLEEAPFMVLSNYEDTIFMHRNLEDVMDKTLWVSPVIRWNNTQPSVKAAWLFLLEEAAKHQDAKALLRRNAVPLTPLKGYAISPQPTPPSAAPKSGSSRKRQRSKGDALYAKESKGYITQALQPGHTSQQAGLSRTPSPPTSEDECVPHTPAAEVDKADALLLWEPEAGVADTSGLGEKRVLGMAELALTSHCLGTGECGHVLRGAYEGLPAAVKLFNPKVDRAEGLIATELDAYEWLDKEQGQTVARVLAYGVLGHTFSPVLVTEYVGQGLSPDSPPEVKAAAMRALKVVHGYGVAHGDIQLRHFLIADTDNTVVKMIDFGRAKIGASANEFEREVKELQELLDELP